MITNSHEVNPLQFDSENQSLVNRKQYSGQSNLSRSPSSANRDDQSPSRRPTTTKNTISKPVMNSEGSEDSLEYYIKFPLPNFRNENDDLVFVYNDSNVPVVLLLGWAGCQDRYLMKYSKIYEDRGLITIRYTAPVESMFWKRSAMIPIGEKIVKLIYDMNFDKHPMIVHVFSNGGAYLYQHISVAMKETNRPINIKGMIFDSAPGDRRIMSLYRAMCTIYGGKIRNPIIRSIIAWAISITLSVMWITEETYLAFKSLFKKVEGAPQTKPYSDLKTEYTNFPQLFLYTKADPIIPYTDIEHFADFRQKERGVDVTKICFEDAEHVKIFIKYPQQYVQYLCSFLNSCLNSYKNISNKFA
ncbi:transmembrane protein 53-A [Condylostylus longicornis]|uniref:transmembrane protein 53-A n=1 Tax=Condylostylus longicornis TaxID=2530218 RepID=UPI00244DE420|nr:transmembrane protein 53-A [Condylostylus longicornis]